MAVAARVTRWPLNDHGHDRSSDYSFVMQCWTREELDSYLTRSGLMAPTYFGAYAVAMGKRQRCPKQGVMWVPRRSCRVALRTRSTRDGIRSWTESTSTATVQTLASRSMLTRLAVRACRLGAISGCCFSENGSSEPVAS
jgi:hypothetical protein